MPWRPSSPPPVHRTRGPSCRLDDTRLDRLAQALEQGPAAHGFAEDQRWTLARVSDLIARMFHTRYTLRGVSYLLHRKGSPADPHAPGGRTRRGRRQHLAAGGVASGKR
ncbi:winged helix-turn-helix domain-containing protein [Umezawaea sp. Da 62-37]|uniref:winged helix-turn-helix domain-containing protein n=1 Tax=Umezawaea sp. Da 62-37 TaxID=3075927 RepID=UPI0037DCCB98